MSSISKILLLSTPCFSTNQGLQHPKFPDAYTAVVTLELPYAGLDIPLTFQFDKTKNLEKIDYYQGLQQDYYMNGNSYKYVFENSVRKCMANEAPHHEGEGGGLVMVVPQDLDQYQYAGKKVMGGQELDRYILSQSHGSTGSMDDHLEFLHDPLLNKPVQWHMHSRNRVFGSHTDEYIVRYLSFLPAESGSISFSLPAECTGSKLQVNSKHLLSMPAESVFHRSVGKKVTAKISPTFKLFAMKHKLQYTSAKEWERREQIFHKNVKLVAELNEKHMGKATFKLNKYAAMERDEMFGSRLGRKIGKSGRQPTPSHHLQSLRSRTEYPKSFDWRAARPGVIAPIRDQGICGSCWAFSLVSAIESANFLASSGSDENGISSPHITALPEQFVIDCTWQKDLNACDGGLSNVGARTIVEKYGGIFPTAESYGHYLTVDGYCRAKPSTVTDVRSTNTTEAFLKSNTNLLVGAKITEYVDIPSRDQNAVMSALLQQPLSIAYNVGAASLFYDSGVIDAAECEHNTEDDLNHAINLVGYGTDEATGLEYWLIRNSWSTYWGDEGYFKVVRGDRDCGVTTDAGYPIVEGDNSGKEAEIGEMYI